MMLLCELLLLLCCSNTIEAAATTKRYISATDPTPLVPTPQRIGRGGALCVGRCHTRVVRVWSRKGTAVHFSSLPHSTYAETRDSRDQNKDRVGIVGIIHSRVWNAPLHGRISCDVITTEQEGELDQRSPSPSPSLSQSSDNDNEDLDMGVPNTSTTTRIMSLSESFAEFRWNV
eukprot:scaffold20941_cov143-Skeletonema_marinoi.AAC.5